jgi:CYTH domain-containing protein
VRTERRFLVAPSFARLIQRERGTAGRFVEAYFPPRPDRRQLVRVEPHRSSLVLLTQDEDGRFAEEQTEIPLHHAEALIDVAAGTVAYDRTILALAGADEASLDRFIVPSGLDLVTVTTPADSHALAPLPWFGLEVTDEPAFASMALALDGAPRVNVMEPSNGALEALLDALEDSGYDPFEPAAGTDAGDDQGGATAPFGISAAL